jgi:hypothetical protein
MKKILILFTLLVGATFIANAQSAPAEFKFEKESHNFGKVVLGTPVSVDFVFTNTGDVPLKIAKVETSCGCTVSKHTETPVAKGQKGFITVTFSPAGAALPFSKIVTINSNAKTSTKVLYIKGETVAK